MVTNKELETRMNYLGKNMQDSPEFTHQVL